MSLDGDEPDDVTHVDRTGAVIDGFVLEQLIGVGGLAEVYAASHPSQRGAFAVKITRGRASPMLRKRFEREARILRELSHPNLVRGVASGVVDGSPYIVMPRLAGRTLRQVIDQDGPLPLARVTKLTLGIASGLAAAHRAKIVHRDLKPTNIIVADDPLDHVRILDFGIARAYDGAEMRTRLTSVGITGTPLYMAPEQIALDGETSPSTDLYALGAIVCTMLTGQPPFMGTLPSVLKAHLKADPSDMSEYGRIGDLATAMLAKAVEDRPASAQVIVDALRDEAPTITHVPEGGDDTRVVEPNEARLQTQALDTNGPSELPWAMIGIVFVSVAVAVASGTATFLSFDESEPTVRIVPGIAPNAVPAPTVIRIADRPDDEPTVVPSSPQPEPETRVRPRPAHSKSRTTKPSGPPLATQSPPPPEASVDERLTKVRTRLGALMGRASPEVVVGLEDEYLAVRAMASQKGGDDEGVLRRLAGIERTISRVQREIADE